MEQQLYHLTLLLSGITCIVMAAALSYNNFYYRDYRIYKRSRLLTALTLTTFGIGFLLHLYFGWRTCWPSAATALSVTYFHIGGTMLSWSHTSLLNPEYLNRFRVIRDMTALVVNIVTLWTGVFFDISFLTGIGIGIFLTHVTWMSTDFLRTYLRVSRLVRQLPITKENAHWWTIGAQHSTFYGQRSMSISCYLIILFGLGSIIMTALLPHVVWPYSVLLCVGNAVFCYIYYSLDKYGAIIEAATNATEDIHPKTQPKTGR